MAQLFILLLILALLLPVVFGIIGIVYLFNKDAKLKKRGGILMLAGVLIFLVEILIGYSICSNMSLGGLH